jgi:hypothetical protein
VRFAQPILVREMRRKHGSDIHGADIGVHARKPNAAHFLCALLELGFGPFLNAEFVNTRSVISRYAVICPEPLISLVGRSIRALVQRHLSREVSWNTDYYREGTWDDLNQPGSGF